MAGSNRIGDPQNTVQLLYPTRECGFSIDPSSYFPTETDIQFSVLSPNI
jgi:hypothetical protein